MMVVVMVVAVIVVAVVARVRWFVLQMSEVVVSMLSLFRCFEFLFLFTLCMDENGRCSRLSILPSVSFALF